MPLYQYGCTACDATVERRQSFSEPPLVECPECGGTLRKVLHPVGVIFKGSGWYCTDSRPKKTDTEGCPAKESCSSGSTCAA